MPAISIEHLSDARLDPYRELKHPAHKHTDTVIAEGEKLALRLLASDCRVKSLVCTPAALAQLRAHIPDDVPVYLLPPPLVSELVGFSFHRGVLACGDRPRLWSLDELIARRAARTNSLLVACPNLRDPENLGTIIRTAEAFGATGVVLGRSGTEPFSRRVLRTSMGSVLRLPIAQCDDWNQVLARLDAAGYLTLATVLDDTAVTLLEMQPAAHAAVFLGNEAEGLPNEISQACHLRVCLPMSQGVDSLNVAVAAGIVMHHFAGGPR